jgi:hypothetical protein
MSQSTSRKLKFIGCEIIYREACALAARSPHKVDLQFLRKGLHDLKSPDMLKTVQSAVDAVEDGYEAVICGYARCNDGLAGLTARRAPLVVARAHDCITFFFGSRRAYREYFDAHPGTYYRTTGWTERSSGEGVGQEGVMSQLGLNRSYADLVARYGRENADFITQVLGNWTANYDNLCYLEMGVCDERTFIELARAEARQRNWRFDCRRGDWSLLEKLFFGLWDEDFVVLQPGQRLVARNDESVLAAE